MKIKKIDVKADQNGHLSFVSDWCENPLNQKRISGVFLSICAISVFGFFIHSLLYGSLHRLISIEHITSQITGQSTIFNTFFGFLHDFISRIVRLRLDSVFTSFEIVSWTVLISVFLLFSYLLPNKYKYYSHLAGFWILFLLVYPLRYAFSFIYFILWFYLISHPTANRIKVKLLLAGLLLIIMTWNSSLIIEKISLLFSYFIILFTVSINRQNKFRIKKVSAPSLIAVSLVLLLIFFSKTDLISDFSNWEIALPFFIFISFGIRLLFHYFEQRDKQLPENLSLRSFLAHFCLLPDFLFPVWWLHPGQGVQYLSEVYLNRDLNKIILDGVKSFLLGVAYILLLVPLVYLFFSVISTKLNYSIPSLGNLYEMYLRNENIPILYFIISTFWGFLIFSLSLIGIMHLKVGLYRMFGYDIKSYTHYPWTATRLPDFWKRYGYHYMQMVLKGFYLPMFLKLKKYNLILRISIATFYAFFVGQYLTWMIFRVSGSNALKVTPYLLILTIATLIAFVRTQPDKRHPWTLDWKLPLDFLKSSSIFCLFAFAHLFCHPEINHTSRWAGSLIYYVVMQVFE